MNEQEAGTVPPPEPFLPQDVDEDGMTVEELARFEELPFDIPRD